jgi:hypothetical protein
MAARLPCRRGAAVSQHGLVTAPLASLLDIKRLLSPCRMISARVRRPGGST